jgi:23S rRNA pseudouridine955/2504/2580 synthase
MLKWRVGKKEAGTRLLQFLREKCPEAPSVKALKRAIDGKLCAVNGRIETFSSRVLEENDLVALEEKTQITGKISVLYEDNELLIVNKPAGVVSEIRSIKKHFPNIKDLALVHRLDKETSGVLILTKTASAKEKMLALFKERGIRKLYLAIVDGKMEKDEGKIDNFLGKKHSYQGQAVYGSIDESHGERAITHWKCLAKSKTASVVSCEPYTGRTHQLRAHLSGLHHPILGDVQYGKKFVCPYKPQRNLLHAYRLVFKHPSTRKEVNVVAPIPADFKQALIALKVSLDGASD